MKIISWNVNGLKSCINKGLLNFIKKENADIYCFQEIKISPSYVEQVAMPKGYFPIWYLGKKKGYSGLLNLSKEKPVALIIGLGKKDIDKEARVIAFEFKKFFFINVYFPHSHRKLTRLKFKLNFNKEFLKFCKRLSNKKPLIIGGDFNVAHKEIDLRNPKQNEKNAGFTLQERNWFDDFLKSGYIDTFREFVKEGGHYTWWTWRNNARKRNIGWRIDYLVISKKLIPRLYKAKILEKVIGSDHCPISMEIKI